MLLVDGGSAKPFQNAAGVSGGHAVADALDIFSLQTLEVCGIHCFIVVWRTECIAPQWDLLLAPEPRCLQTPVAVPQRRIVHIKRYAHERPDLSNLGQRLIVQ
jgi:hypothetical protein